jgi:hypothetical protein
MPLKLLVPVLPSDRFYDAVVAAGDLLSREGGTLTFLFTKTRPPPMWEERQDVGFDGELQMQGDVEGGEDEDVESWQQQMISGMGDASDLLLERGVSEGQVAYLFADDELGPAEAIAGEAAAGAYDMVVLPKGAFVSMPTDLGTPGGAPPEDIAEAIQELSDDGVKLLVT